jgi:hypothetical protein
LTIINYNPDGWRQTWLWWHSELCNIFQWSIRITSSAQQVWTEWESTTVILANGSGKSPCFLTRHFHLIVQHMCWITNTWQGHIHAHFLQGDCKVLCLCEQLPYKHVYQMGEHWVCIKSVPNGCLCAIWTVWFWDSSNVEKGIMLHIEGVEPKPCHSHGACHKCGSCSNAWRVSIIMNSSNPCSSKSLSLWTIASLTCSLMTKCGRGCLETVCQYVTHAMWLLAWMVMIFSHVKYWQGRK